MNTRVPQPTQEPLLSRRQLLEATARAAAGTMIAPTVLLSATGCSKVPVPAPPEEPGVLTLRAVRLRGAPDGRDREIWSYNGNFPGPLIRVKEGDSLRIKVINGLADPTSIHWHGMHQPGTWRMDGVDGVSNSPILPGEDFTYEFRATPAGTHWYHSHVGVQYSEGLFGPLVVDEQTPIAKYDRDEVLLINDWFLQSGDTLLEGLLKGGMGKMPGKMEMKDGKGGMGKMAGKMDRMEGMDVGDIPFQSGLINGKGRLAADTKTPLTVIEVQKGETLRLRLINASSTYALRFQIDGHPLTVIASDGPPMKPVAVDNLLIGIGERYDVLLEAKEGGAHWIRAVTLDGNEIRAILRYPDASGTTPEAKPVQWGTRALKPEEMRSREPVQRAEKPREIPLFLGGSMMPYRWTINSQAYPKADPVEIAKDEVIRFTLRNPTGMDHPFHLHGHSFHVLGRPGALNLTDPVRKDTINVPSKGEVVIEWLANNPGRWFFHCHIEWHLAAGMARVLEIKPYA
jgi:FtsP/CotA-like multicopper oxidase with cupredoxin domain